MYIPDLCILNLRSVPLIINIIGKSDLLLFDSYMNEYPKTLNPGDWIHIPGWLMHASQPCKEKRSILVIDYKK
jgi:hypothetical protein